MSTESVAADLADALRRETVRTGAAEPRVRGGDGRLAVVDVVGTNGTITTTDGIVARRLEMYRNAEVGDVVVLSRFSSGSWVAVGRQASSTDQQFADYVPTVTGAGAATWSAQSGYYFKIGKLVYFNVGLVASAAGSGTSAVQVDAPSTIDRSIRQTVALNCEGISRAGAGAFAANGHAVSFSGGSGATWDRLRIERNNANNIAENLGGSDILSGSIIAVTGWYREA
ncbi:hypothetical protein ACWGI0_23300 [Streptomyces sp. NPDC054802]